MDLQTGMEMAVAELGRNERERIVSKSEVDRLRGWRRDEKKEEGTRARHPSLRDEPNPQNTVSEESRSDGRKATSWTHVKKLARGREGCG